MKYDQTAAKGASSQIARACASSKKTMQIAIARLDHQEIGGEFDWLELLDEESFECAREQHLTRRELAPQSDNLGVMLLLSLVGVPISLLAGMFTGEAGYFFGVAFWLIIAVSLYAYLGRAAKYWREHAAVRREEVRRHGRTSFG